MRFILPVLALALLALTPGQAEAGRGFRGVVFRDPPRVFFAAPRTVVFQAPPFVVQQAPQFFFAPAAPVYGGAQAQFFFRQRDFDPVFVPRGRSFSFQFNAFR